jgi:ubiquinone biosynthesis accessory factor UbiK
MSQANLLDEVGAKIREILASSPARDLETNLRALLASVFERLDLATREQLDVQERVLARTREKLSALEARVADLEARLRQR